jgi:hypothetical protein
MPEGLDPMSDDARPRPLPVRPSHGPTPVRGGVAEPSKEPSDEARKWVAPDGTSWDVRIAGRGRTGRGADPGADLALLVFEPAGSDRVGGEGSGSSGDALEVMAVVESLADLSDAALAAHHATARPFRPLPPKTHDGPSPRRRPRRG